MNFILTKATPQRRDVIGCTALLHKTNMPFGHVSDVNLSLHEFIFACQSSSVFRKMAGKKSFHMKIKSRFYLQAFFHIIFSHVCSKQKAETYSTSYDRAFICPERYTTACGKLDWRRPARVAQW